MLTEEDILPRELTNNIPRRGKWTAEEERYTEKIICDFEHGTLDVPEGTTLRTLLAKVLNCDPMRITKKYTGNSSIGKRTFVPLVRTPENAIFMDMSQQELRELRAIWVNKLILMEQWNNRKMNLMKAHMGLGGPYDPSGSNPHGRFDPPGSGNMLTCPTPQAAMLLQRQASGVHDYNLSLNDLNNFTHLHSMHAMNAMSLPLPMGMNGLNGMNGPSGMNSSNTNGLPDMNGLNGTNGRNNMSNLDSSLEAFQEVSLRLSLEPYVSAPSEMDFIIKWLRTLNIVVTSGRTLSPADLEHSLSARSISLPALVAIYRSNCVAEHTRLRQLHETIETYLRQIGITFPVADNNNKSILPEVLSAKPTSSNGNNGASTSATESNTTSVKSSLTSSDGLVNPVSSPKSNANERATPLPGVTSINTEGTADSTGAIFTENSPLLLSRDTLSAKPLINNTTMSADKNTTTSNNSVTKNTSAGAVPFIPAHLQHHFATSKQSVAPLPVPTTTTSNNNTNTALTTHLSSLFGTKYNLLPYAPEPGSEALYQAEQQALAFAEQQARAHAAAQAQAKALAESYQYPTAKETPKVAELNRASSSGTEISGIGEGGEGDADDHLMLYHKALVQSLAAGRKQKRSAAATAKSHSAAILSSNPNNQTNHSSNSSNSVTGNNNSNSGTSASNAMNSAASFAANQRDVNSAKNNAMVPAGPLQPQKRRKLAEYTDMFNRAAYPNNYVPYPHMSPSLNNAMEQQMQLLGNAGGEDKPNSPNNPYGSGYNNRLYPNSMDYAAMYARMPGFSGAVDPNLSAMYANMLNRNVPAGSNPAENNTSAAVNPLSSVLANSSNTSNNPTNANTSSTGSNTNINATGTTANLQLGTQPITADPSAHAMAALAQAYEATQRRSSGIPYLPASMPGSAHFNAQAAAQAMAHSANVSGLTNSHSGQGNTQGSAPSNPINVQPHPATLSSAPTNTTTSSNTTNTNTMSNAPTGLPMQSPFSPELLAMYMQQMYSTWPYPGMSAVPGGNLNTNLNNNMNNMNNNMVGLSNSVGTNGSNNNPGNNNNMSNAQAQLQHAQMLHFAESLHHAALANSNRHNNEMLQQQQQQQQLQQMQQQRANSNPQPNANHNSSSSGTSSYNNTSSNNNNSNNNSTGNTASARAYAEMHMAQERQVPTYSTDPNNHSGTSIATKNMHLMGPLGPKVTLDEYLKSMQQRNYPYNTQGQSAAARAEGRINHANATAASNAALLNNKSSIHNASQGMQLNANREIYANLPYMAGQNYYSDSVNASLAGTKGSHTDKSPSATSTGSGNNADSAVNNATAESHETDREGKEKGHSAAAEALLTLLKK